MPALFNEKGIRFEYPENWRLEVPEVPVGEGSVSVASPNTGFWSVTTYTGTVDSAHAVEEVLAAMRADYPELEAYPAEEEIEQQLMSGYDLEFYCLDLLSTACVRGFRREDTTYLLLWQAEDHEMESIGSVFRAITTSLIREYC